jgi:DNA-directed RNA polymerase III subunit RPC6
MKKAMTDDSRLKTNADKFLEFLKTCPEMTDTPKLREKAFGKNFKELLPSIQHLSDEGHVTMLTVDKDLCFRVTSDSAREHFNKFKGMTEVELLTYRTVEAAGDKGIVLNELRYKVQLHNHSHQLKKIINKLESRKLIKMFKPFNDPHKKYYITFDMRPAKEVQGGVWYSNGEQDEGAMRAMEMILLGKKGLMNTLYKKKGCTAKQLTKEILRRKLFHEDTRITVDDVKQYLECVCFDGKLQRIHSRTRLRPGYGGDDASSSSTVYIRVPPRKTSRRIQSLTSIPCGVCKLQDQCTPGGVISPQSCPYLVDWMDTF